MRLKVLPHTALRDTSVGVNSYAYQGISTNPKNIAVGGYSNVHGGDFQNYTITIPPDTWTPQNFLRNANMVNNQYRGFAYQQMQILRDQLTLAGIPEGRRVVNLNNGVQVQCSINYTQASINIVVPRPGKPLIKREEFVWSSHFRFYDSENSIYKYYLTKFVEPEKMRDSWYIRDYHNTTMQYWTNGKDLYISYRAFRRYPLLNLVYNGYGSSLLVYSIYTNKVKTLTVSDQDLKLYGVHGVHYPPYITSAFAVRSEVVPDPVPNALLNPYPEVHPYVAGSTLQVICCCGATTFAWNYNNCEIWYLNVNNEWLPAIRISGPPLRTCSVIYWSEDGKTGRCMFTGYSYGANPRTDPFLFGSGESTTILTSKTNQCELIIHIGCNIDGIVTYTTEAVYHADTTENDYITFMDVVGNDPVYMRVVISKAGDVETEKLTCNGKELILDRHNYTDGGANCDEIRLLYFDLRTKEVFHSYVKKFYTSYVTIIDPNNRTITIDSTITLYAFNGIDYVILDTATEARTERLYYNGIWNAEDVYELLEFNVDENNGTAKFMVSTNIGNLYDRANCTYLVLPQKGAILTTEEESSMTEEEKILLRTTRSINNTKVFLSVANQALMSATDVDKALLNVYYNDLEITVPGLDIKLSNCKKYFNADLLGGEKED